MLGPNSNLEVLSLKIGRTANIFMSIYFKIRWLLSPHSEAQQGLSHDTLQCDKNDNCSIIIVKLDSDNPIILYIYIYVMA